MAIVILCFAAVCNAILGNENRVDSCFVFAVAILVIDCILRFAVAFKKGLEKGK